jgi:flavin reductase (DIM6/NTAB) family NADH-FMN oxidoreductase RutF
MANVERWDDVVTRRSHVYYSGFYPMHLALLTVADNLMPMAWWTPISKEPFRLLLAMDQKNYTLRLLRAHHEAVLNFLPWSERERVVRAGYLSGRKVKKAARLGFHLLPAQQLTQTGVVDGASTAFELTVRTELEGLSGDHVPFVCDVVHVHRRQRPATGEPLLFLGYRDFATLGERWRFKPRSGT